MAVNKSKARKIKRRLAYVYFPIIFAVIGVLLVRFVFVSILPESKYYHSMAFGDPPSFSEQLEKKSFIPFEGSQGKRFNNINVTLPAVNQQYAEMKCEEMDIDAPVFWGDTNLILKSGVGTYLGSALPGYNSTVLMSAHNTTYFKNLKNAKAGDVIHINTTYARFEYVVREVKVFRADDSAAVDYNSKTEQLVLYTCYPFKPLSAVSDARMFVYCDKLSGPSASNWEVDL